MIPTCCITPPKQVAGKKPKPKSTRKGDLSLLDDLNEPEPKITPRNALVKPSPRKALVALVTNEGFFDDEIRSMALKVGVIWGKPWQIPQNVLSRGFVPMTDARAEVPRIESADLPYPKNLQPTHLAWRSKRAGNGVPDFPFNGSVRERLSWWINHSNDTDISSNTIASICAASGVYRDLGGLPFSTNPPKDADDFGRCVRLIERIPEWMNAIWRVGQKEPNFYPIIINWNSLVCLYKNGAFHDCYKGIQKLRGNIPFDWQK